MAYLTNAVGDFAPESSELACYGFLVGSVFKSVSIITLIRDLRALIYRKRRRGEGLSKLYLWRFSTN